MSTALPGSRSSSNGLRPGAGANWSSSRNRWAASCTVWARYTRRRLVVEEGAAQLAISGHVRIAQTERWLRGLPQFAPVQVSVLDDGGLRIARRGGRAEP